MQADISLSLYFAVTTTDVIWRRNNNENYREFQIGREKSGHGTFKTLSQNSPGVIL